MKILEEKIEGHMMTAEEAKVYVSEELQTFKSPVSPIVRELIFGGDSGRRIDWNRVAKLIYQYIPELQVDKNGSED